MRLIRQFFFAFSISFVFFMSPAAAKAQIIVNYLFLEAADSNGKPVGGATVETPVYFPQTVQTDEKGQAKMENSSYVRKILAPEFTIAKAGYLPFQDFGEFDFAGNRSVKVELLKIPMTENECKALGNEQHKREFIWAAQNGDAQTVRRLLKAGISPNLTTDDLRDFANPHDASSDGVPAVVYAAASGDGETIKTILRAGADVRPRRNPITDGILFFYLSADSSAKRKHATEAEKTKLTHEYEDGLKKLIEAGAYINGGDYPSKNRVDDTALMVAVRKGYVGAVRILIGGGASVAASNLDRITPLMTAAQMGNAEIVRLLIEKGVPVDARDASGRTALMHVGFYESMRRVETADLLIKAGADPNALNENGTYYLLKCETPLMLAVAKNDAEMTGFLIANRADVNLACPNGDTALKYAKQQRQYGEDNRELIKLLEAAGAK